MEPDHEGREDALRHNRRRSSCSPAMEPDHEGREDESRLPTTRTETDRPQWSPTMKVGKTGNGKDGGQPGGRPAMEPDHEGREDMSAADIFAKSDGPQWSPTMKVGKTRPGPG